VTPGGCVVLSTPNRLTFSPGLPRLGRPPSAYHVREYDADELRAELHRWLPTWTVRLHGLREGPRLRRAEGSHATILAGIRSIPPEAWPDELARQVRAVGAGDFEVGAVDDECLDLVAVLAPTPLGQTGAS
jgi:hypothetical protein